MKKAIIASKKDPAGLNIAKQLIENFGFKETEKEFDSNKVFAFNDFELYFIEKDQLEADYVNQISANFLVFASRHSSKSGKPSLTCHAPGNWGSAEYGGKPSTLSPAFAGILKNYLLALKEHSESLPEFSATLECTHHGPLAEKPCAFIELGSSEKQWVLKKPAEAIAEIIVSKTILPKEYKTVIGIGGNHYCNEFSKLSLRSDYAFSHICPQYALPDFSSELLAKAVAATEEKVEGIVVDYKGLGKEKARVMEILEQSDLEIKRVRKLLEETK
jgi:D-aminoacyl-tRNA deacylase